MADVIRIHDLVRSTLGRFAEPAQGLLPPGILGYDPGRRRHSISREQAAEWISSAELKTPIRLKASVHPLMQDRYSSLLKDLLKAWSEIGIEIDIQTPDIKSYNDSFEFNEGFDLLIGRWIADYDDPDALTYSLFHSEIGEFRNYYHSKEFDQLAEQARTETAPDQREKLYRKLDNFPKEMSFLLPLFHEIDYRVANPKVRKLELSSISPYVNYSRLAKTESADTQAAETKSERGSLTVPISGSLRDLDPSLAGVYWQVLVVPTIFETLTGAAEGARVRPWLASGFQAEEGATKFRFYLREGVRFHDGRRLTARDVRYSFEHLLQNKETQYSWLLSPIRGAKEILNGQAKELAGFKIVSALEFVIELDQPLSFFPALLAYTATSIIPEGAERFSGSWREGCVGTGPFRVVSFEPGRTLKVEANPDYWRPGFPKLESIDFQFGISSAESLAGFKSGRYSIAWDLLPTDVEALLHEPEYAAKYFEIPSLITYYLVLNAHLDPTSDAAVRHRLIDSLNVAGLTRRNIGRLAVPANSLTPTGLLGYEPPPRIIATAPAKKSGAELELSAMLHSVYESRYAGFTRELFQNMSDRGFHINAVETKGEFLPAAAYPSVHLNLTRWVADYPDADTFMYYLLHSQHGVEGSLCGNPDLDRMLEKGRTESDPLVRQAIYKQVEEIIRTNALLLPLFHEQAYCFARPKVEGLELNFFHPYLSYEKMWIRK